MFLDFAGMMINTNYIISIYKVENYGLNNKIKYCVEIKFNNIQNYEITKEYYDNEKERNKRFDEIIYIINNK